MARVNQGNAARVTFTLLQGQDVLGTGSKPVNVVQIWFNAASAVSGALVVQAASASLQTPTTVTDKIVVFEFMPDMCLDLVNGFHTIAVETSASNAANITAAKLFVLGAHQDASAPSSYHHIQIHRGTAGVFRHRDV